MFKVDTKKVVCNCNDPDKADQPCPVFLNPDSIDWDELIQVLHAKKDDAAFQRLRELSQNLWHQRINNHGK